MRTVYQEFNLKKRTPQLLSLHQHLKKKTFKNNQRTLGCYSRTRTAEIVRGSNKKIKIWRKFSHGSKINSDRTEGAGPGRLKNYGSMGSILRIFLSWMELFIGKKLEMSGTVVQQLVVAESQITNILPLLHESPCTGHLGFAKTYHRAQERFFWPGMKSDVREWVSSCDECLRRKGTPQKHRHSLTTWQASHPFWQVSLDVMGHLPDSQGCR